VNHATIERELAAHDERLAELPRVLALSKADLLSAERVREAVGEWKRRLGPDVAVIATSSATGAGIKQLTGELLRRVGPAHAVSAGISSAAPGSGPGPLAGTPEAEPVASGAGGAGEEELAEHMVFRPAERTGFSVRRLGPRTFAVTGRGIERLVGRYDIENADALAYVEERLRRIGVLRALEAEGFRPGDAIEIGAISLELDPGAKA